MGNDSYRILLSGGQGEYEEKKSRFIATVRSVQTEEEAVSFIEEMKKKYWDARHNCSAYILPAVPGQTAVLHSSDDGEPSGTAGRPMLDILKGRELTYTLACVTRYFGGVLLGTGGLVRAYSDSLMAALENAQIVKKQLCRKLSFSMDYQMIGKLKYVLDDYQAKMLKEEYGTMVDITIAIPEDMTERFKDYLTQTSAGKISVTDEGTYFV